MNAYVIKDGKGEILSVHRTTDGVVHAVMGHGDQPKISEISLDLQTLDKEFENKSKVSIEFDDKEILSVERHALLI
jgi:nitrogen regulatory protein PII